MLISSGSQELMAVDSLRERAEVVAKSQTKTLKQNLDEFKKYYPVNEYQPG
tara:strand:+ start:220 stop:372 length:153 start_codon:yes stop_codon:yes gene_type:complete